MAIAIAASVTVSIAALTSGMFNATRREKRVVTSASRGRKSEAPGIRRTSSKVYPSGMS